jgi:hypothetical protein
MRKSAVTILVVLIVLTTSACGIYRYEYPLGMEHRCDTILWFALHDYAKKHGGAFPTGQATPEASISLIHSFDEFGGDYASVLHRRDVSIGVVQQMLQSGKLLDPSTCGWNYVEGLRLGSSSGLALFWDKEGLGHIGNRLSEGGHIVTFANGQREHIPGLRWKEFLAEQRRLLAQKRGQNKQGTIGGLPYP